MPRTLLLASIALCACLCATTGCGGRAGLDYMNGQTSLRYPSTYNPLAPTQAAPAGVDRAAALPGLALAGRSVIAATAADTADPVVQDALRLSGTGDTLVVGLQHSLPSAVLYVRYDASREHLATSSTTAGDTALSLVHEVEPGLLAVTVAALGGASLHSGELARMQFAPGRATVVRASSAITNDLRSTVTDLSIVDNQNTSVTLHWSERNTGDYDLNGEVNGADLVRISQHFKKTFVPADSDWAQLEVIDGDGNGEINGADITPIAQNYKSFIQGYNIYRTPLANAAEVPDSADTARWTKVPNVADPAGPSAPRENNGQDFRFTYTFIDQSGGGDFGWYVRPVSPTGEQGRIGDVKTFTVGGGQPPDAGLSFEIQPPQGNAIALNDDIYIAVKITGAAGLFSANVRFEYDSTLLQFVEAVPAYTDGNGAHPNLLSPPLFIGADNVGSATSPYRLLGFNATQTFGTPAVTGDGALGYVHFKAIANGINTTALRFPQSTNFIYLWGDQYGVPVGTPALGDPLSISVL